MPYTPALSFYLGPAAVYTSPTGMTDVNTGVPYLGGTLHDGDYVDATVAEISQWNTRFGLNFNTGRYRFVRLSPNATAGNIKVGQPVGYGLPTTVGLVTITAPGTGSGSGTVLCSSTTSGGTAATALVTVAAGVITGAQLVYAGANFTSVPTFGLTEISAAGITTSGTINALMNVNPNFVSSFDSSCIDTVSVRGIALCTVTSAQVTANAWIVIQEQGLAPLYVTTATATAAGSVATAASGGAVTTTTSATAPVAGFIGYTVDLAAATTQIRVELDLPIRQG
jgi:hypothetical protein